MQGSSASNSNSDFANGQSLFPTVSTTDVVPAVLVARIGNVWESDLNSENVWESDDYHDVRIIELNSEYVRESDDDDDDLNSRWHPPLNPNAVVASALTMVELVVAEPEVTDYVYVPAPLMENPITEGHPLLELGLARRDGLIVMAENNINILENPQNPTFDVNEDVHDESDHDESDLELDDISYQELLELEEQMRDFIIGRTEQYIVEHLRPLVYHSSIEEDLCCICQEDYVNGEQVARLACAHQFHYNCIKQWLMQKNSCPVCRRQQPLTKRN